jgi:hypothetical protein
MGNLLPALCAAPFAATGFWLLHKYGYAYPPVGVSMLSAIVAGFLGLNWFGYFGNAEMREAMVAKLGEPPPHSLFVGFSRPGQMDWLDPHEDIGFLTVEPQALRVQGERLRIAINRTSVTSIELAPNAHTLLGLGGFVRIDALDAEKKPTILLIETREEPTLFDNKRRRKQLRDRLRAWSGLTNSSGPAA